MCACVYVYVYICVYVYVSLCCWLISAYSLPQQCLMNGSSFIIRKCANVCARVRVPVCTGICIRMYVCMYASCMYVWDNAHIQYLHTCICTCTCLQVATWYLWPWPWSIIKSPRYNCDNVRDRDRDGARDPACLWPWSIIKSPRYNNVHDRDRRDLDHDRDRDRDRDRVTVGHIKSAWSVNDSDLTSSIFSLNFTEKFDWQILECVK